MSIYWLQNLHNLVSGYIAGRQAHVSVQEGVQAAQTPAVPALGQKTVTTAGTAVQLSATSVECKNGVYIKPAIANTGNIYVGYLANVATDAIASTACNTLVPGSGFEFFPCTNLTQVWLDASEDAQVVEYRIY